MNILQLAKDATIASKEAHTMSRKTSNTVTVHAVQCMPVYSMSLSFINTLEYGLVCDRDTEKAIAQAFKTLPADVQEALLYSPARGEWINRARLWKSLLKPVLTPRTYYRVITSFVEWYKRCITMRNARLIQ